MILGVGGLGDFTISLSAQNIGGAEEAHVVIHLENNINQWVELALPLTNVKPLYRSNYYQTWKEF